MNDTELEATLNHDPGTDPGFPCLTGIIELGPFNSCLSIMPPASLAQYVLQWVLSLFLCRNRAG